VAPDVLIIGAGLSGLLDALLMAETGRKVLVLEQHSIPGGYLQQFQRKKTVFDVGFHYLGSTAPGRPIRQFLEHLGVWERLELLPFPDDAAIEVRRGARSFAYPSTYERFLAKAAATWPAERAGLERVTADVERIAAATQWYSLRRGVEYGRADDELVTPLSFARYVEERIEDPWLREVLSFQAFNLGLFAEEIPWTKHLLAFRSNFDVTSRIQGGGGALVAALVARGKELGVEYRFREEVVALEAEKPRALAVRTGKGERIEAELFLAACHPKVVVRWLADEALSPLFRRHILEMRDARGAFQVFLRLRAPVTSIGATCVIVHDEAEAARVPPIGPVLVTNPMGSEHGGRGGPRLEAMTYMGDELFARWSQEHVFKRGPEYDALKGALTERMLGILGRLAPELADLIEDVYAATPLSDLWYTKNEHGAVFGISHELAQQGRDRPQPRLRLENLFLTGHSIHMPGICGVFINAFHTCDLVRGDGVLFPAVASG
jgi:all-trans-retinol 13,14-reductase